jgi:hypothetical protein
MLLIYDFRGWSKEELKFFIIAVLFSVRDALDEEFP